MINAIQHTAEFEGATPEELFGILTNAEEHSAVIGAEAVINGNAGDPFSAFNGMVTGRNHVIIPDALIVQSWRGAAWAADDPDSILILAFRATPRGACIDLLQANIPPQWMKMERWSELYWEPMREYLKRRSTGR